MAAMASIRTRKRADGTTASAVLYQVDNTQTSATFDTVKGAEDFRDAVNTIGAEKAMLAWGIGQTQRAAKKLSGLTVSGWCEAYIKSRTGIAKSTTYDYESYLRNDITPTIGAIPLELLGRDDISTWVQQMTGSGKTIANKHGFVSAALNAAIQAGHIAANPAAGTRLPRTERPEMVFLTHAEFGQLCQGFAERWHPLLEFMVTSGARFGEIAALRPSDIDRERRTASIARAWKRTYEKGGDSYELGVPKTARSVRTINVAASILDTLDYERDWLFTNTRGGPLKVVGWRTNVWYPSVTRARDLGLKKKPRIHDMRHTCASWMIGQGVPLPVIQRHLGHESITTTVDLYGHMDRKDAEAAAVAIAAALRPEGDALL